MSDKNSSDRRVHFRDLNWLGKSVFVGGALARLTGTLVKTTTNRVTRIAEESRRAFERELDPKMEDAQILEEQREDSPDR